MVYELSPGEMQIVEIAKAISAQPKLLILDEPTSALEKAQVQSLFQYMRGPRGKGSGHHFHLSPPVGGDGNLRRHDDLPKW